MRRNKYDLHAVRLEHREWQIISMANILDREIFYLLKYFVILPRGRGLTKVKYNSTLCTGISTIEDEWGVVEKILRSQLN